MDMELEEILRKRRDHWLNILETAKVQEKTEVVHIAEIFIARTAGMTAMLSGRDPLLIVEAFEKQAEKALREVTGFDFDAVEAMREEESH
ncbi:MAG: hypothetical protein KDH09_08740 [Chrysiogenetes bacterium]|nr:hypothetical protein [Chrysiogenetes bacterium]